MKSKYHEIVKHIPYIEDHGNLYMYYGVPYSEDCFVYDAEDGEGGKLILSDECDALCCAIADEFQYEYKWLDIFHENNIEIDEVFDVDIEAQNLEVTASILLYLVASLTYEDRFIDAIENGYLLKVLRRLESLDVSK